MSEEIRTLAEQIGAALQAQRWQLATAESCTGGLVSAAVTEIAGSSGWFDRGFVTYSNEAKVEMLGVSPLTLHAHGAVSEATVREMLAGALAKSVAHVVLAISGIAGPAGGTAEKPVGTVCFGWQRRGYPAQCLTLLLPGDRAAVRDAAVKQALRGLLDLSRSA
ncbi:CinA family protein [Uliginosibacterium aquaticum]|uniref:CinA family protein n=1 Tax=Uliginosibacterium aquaticum TaxID=2731212 RepID=A0ABX2IHC0_9RHOO|nr:CinA family protein [Uliginosibacterium aquaticum]NSL56150.1 CinA family protein [Uliginosibacterium aquaticum]